MAEALSHEGLAAEMKRRKGERDAAECARRAACAAAAAAAESAAANRAVAEADATVASATAADGGGGGGGGGGARATVTDLEAVAAEKAAAASEAAALARKAAAAAAALRGPPPPESPAAPGASSSSPSGGLRRGDLASRAGKRDGRNWCCRGGSALSVHPRAVDPLSGPKLVAAGLNKAQFDSAVVATFSPSSLSSVSSLSETGDAAAEAKAEELVEVERRCQIAARDKLRCALASLSCRPVVCIIAARSEY